MKTLFLADSFLPHAGGSRVYYYNLYKNLVQHCDDEVTVLTTKVAGWEDFDRQFSTDALRISRHGNPLPSWKWYQLPRIVLPLTYALLKCKEKFDMVHSGDLYPSGVIALWLRRVFGIPYVAYCHGEEVTQTDLRRYQPIVRNRIYLLAERVIAVSAFAYDNLLRIGIPPEQIHRIPPGVDCKCFQPRPRNTDLLERFDLRNKRVLLTVSRLVARKGHDVTLQAVARLAREMPDLRYLIVGEGPERKYLERLIAQLGLGGIAILTGCVSREQLSDFYNLGDVFVMANREVGGDIEGFGMVFLEAGAMGLPVVGGRSGGAAEAILEGTTGFLVNPHDADELGSALKKLLMDPYLRQRMGAASLSRVRKEFGWTKRAEELQKVNQEVVLAARARRRTDDRGLDLIKREASRSE